jgi:adenosylmethionine-8-amino-7-oxononanoate aminotransferase
MSTTSAVSDRHARPQPPTTDDLRAWDRDVYWHAFTQMSEYVPLIIDRAEGCTLIDIDGREYLDGVSSLWCNVHGHRHPKIDAAVREQLDRVAHFTSLGASCSTTIRLAKRIADIAPDGLGHVFFSDSGATAVEVGLKMAIQYWQQCENPQPQKTRFVALDLAYHGDTIGAVSVGGIDRFHEIFRPLLFDVMRAETPRADKLSVGDTVESACERYLQNVEQLFTKHHEEIAAFIIEPLVQGAAGIITHPPGYLAGIRRLTRKYDILLIADEVAVGMGRTGTMFACDQEQVVPDILCLAKGITGGYLPLAATVVTDEVYAAFLGEYAEQKTFFHGHTYGGNPLAAAAALATLDVFEEEQTLAAMVPKIAQLEERLARLSQHPHVGSVRQRGLMSGIELVEDRATGQSYPWQQQRGARVCQHALDHGVWLRPLGDVIVVMPPLAIESGQLDQIMDAVEASIDQECGTGGS